MSIEKNTRTIPCEHCRIKRRKCVAMEGTACERCREYGIVCLFRFPIRRTKRIRKRYSKRMAPEAKAAKELRNLEQQATILEEHLRQLSSCDLTRYQRHLSIVMTQQGIRIETPVRSMTDMLMFLEQTWSYFFWDQSLSLRSPSIWGSTEDGDNASVQVTLKRLGTEYRHVCILLSNSNRPIHKRLSSQDTDPFDISSIKHRMIDLFFSCIEYATPIIVRPYFMDLYHRYPDSMITNATVAYVALSPCNHVSLIPFPCTRQAFGQYCLERARKQMEETLFGDDEETAAPSIETMLALWMMGMSLIILLKHDEARMLLDIGWQMAVQLRATYLPVLQHFDDDDSIPLELQAKAETWRRSYALMRFVYQGFTAYSRQNSVMSDDHDHDLSFHSQAGLPKMMPDEQADPALYAVVDAFRHFVEFSIAIPRLLLKLNTGLVEHVSYRAVVEAEQWFFTFWHRLPNTYRLTQTGPLDILDLYQLRQCINPTVLMLHRFYYDQWIMLEMRFMSPPPLPKDTNDQDHPPFHRLDSERALMVVSICCDAFVKLTVVLHEKDHPCIYDVHTALIVAELLDMLRSSSNTIVRNRAEQNLAWCCELLRPNIVDANEQPISATSYFREMGQLTKQYLQSLL
ncbi:hypothetical protein O0I10_011106 [Lichtheimia ornata]|uniref:Zn(2)-C6 fungal-type domain-containing protein n=1 Tax=Lichtheimia ornata TaxID=688661 RepID=A0AAD7XUE0_9FUNG|nr:uncharacterized protein O0I10_011106 [Lichtheimia ornata]KAJ8653258.1 hypothetical protein O0I10_011106 [Lichtheimia ornata]